MGLSEELIANAFPNQRDEIVVVTNVGSDFVRRGVTTQNGTTVQVIVSADRQLGTVASAERFKKDIASMDKTSEAVLLLRPVTFHYKTDTKGAPQFGLIAEEVAKVNPALVLPDKEGKRLLSISLLVDSKFTSCTGRLSRWLHRLVRPDWNLPPTLNSSIAHIARERPRASP
jgi:hypothetical protein